MALNLLIVLHVMTQNLSLLHFYFGLYWLTEMTGMRVLIISSVCQLIMINSKSAESPDEYVKMYFIFFCCAFKLVFLHCHVFVLLKQKSEENLYTSMCISSYDRFSWLCLHISSLLKNCVVEMSCNFY